TFCRSQSRQLNRRRCLEWRTAKSGRITQIARRVNNKRHGYENSLEARKTKAKRAEFVRTEGRHLAVVAAAEHCCDRSRRGLGVGLHRMVNGRPDRPCGGWPAGGWR